MHWSSNLQALRIRRAKQNRYNPLPSLTDPALLARKLDAFEAGYLKDVVNIWDSLEQRDDLIRAVVSKRKKAVGRQGWTVLIHESVPAERRTEAEAHATALEYFYQNLRCENALDRAERGGFKLLCRQMMDAVGKRFAVHEIVWTTLQCGDHSEIRLSSATSSPLSPKRDSSRSHTSAQRHSESATRIPHLDSRSERPAQGNTIEAGLGAHSSAMLSATFRFVPLSFFENTTGQLRYLESESSVEGTALEPGAWMITTGEGLMFATSNAWIIKNLALNDWLLYSERNGRPILHGTTAAAANSDEWKSLENTLAEILSGSAVVHSSSDDVKVLDLAVGGNIPFRNSSTAWTG